MIKFSKLGAASILMTTVMLAPAWAAEQNTNKTTEPVRTAAVASPALDIAHRSTAVGETTKGKSRDSNGWGMLAAGLSVGLLIIARRRRG